MQAMAKAYANLKLKSYQGVHGIMRKYGKDLYLEMEKQLIEVPLWYWKVVVDENTGR